MYKAGQVALLAVAKNKSILLFEVFPSTELRTSLPRYRKIKEFQFEDQIQFMEILRDRLCLASENGVKFFDFNSGGTGMETGLKPHCLLNVADDKHPLYQLLNYRPLDVLNVVDLSPVYPEYLVCFSLFGIYIGKNHIYNFKCERLGL